ncbi:hypothetical protein Btru_060849 [Bulinus truncatus]|nr:hypothetical protein Btru_060849 [Bulinus truncatus]
MVLETQESSAPPPASSGSRKSPRNSRPVVRRSRISSSESENSNGSRKSHGSRSNTPGPNVNTAPGSNSGSRNPSFRGDRPPSTVSSRRSPASSGQRNTSGSRGGGGGGGGSSAGNSNGNVNNLHSSSSNGDQARLPPDQYGPRRRSMPNVTENFLSVPSGEDTKDSRLRRVRSFKTTSKGVVVNRGDSFKIKSTNSLMSAGNAITEATRRSQQIQVPVSSANNNIDADLLTPEAPPIPTYYRVIMMGGAGCGKSLMAKQFLTSDYVGESDDNLDYNCFITKFLTPVLPS